MRQNKGWVRGLGIVLGALLVLLGGAGAAGAQPAIFPQFMTVTVDGNPVASGYAAAVLYQGGVFHLWYRDALAAGLGTISHATSADGLNFTTTGALSFAVDPFTAGTAPYLYYENAAIVGGEAKLIHWTSYGDAGAFPAYDYNNSVSNVGSTFGNLSITHQGPIGGGTIGQTAGSFGIVGGYWYGQCGNTGQEVCRSPYTDGAPPNVGASIYPSVLDASALFSGLGIATGYINNHCDVIAGQTGLDMFLTLRTDSSGARFDEQVYWAGSSDGGATWSAPVALLTSPTLDGGAFGGNFAHPEALWTGARYFLYVSAQNASEDYVLALAVSGGTPLVEIPALSLAGIAALVLALAALGFMVLRRV